ncbi:MAG: hypothetical protein JWQ89_2451 [Devosia sp.]|uniref:class I SAM-dependent methyltransferase n=1 Tax=Devosia sp. TaxID=1871048 RepID=UPI002619AF2C|nr:class I SAM-dependent methyltransferase [Devosia sp.]MDB5540724.1 hypothetical protein [Devosia sp.]
MRIATRGTMETGIPDAAIYATVDYAQIRDVLTSLAIGSSDVFVDVGCGRGRVLCCAARIDCQAVVGVDMSPELCADARANAARMRFRRTPITVHEVEAQNFDYSGATALYFFNPFGAVTLDAVLSKLRADTSGSPLRLAFVNIAPHTQGVFALHDWLKLQAFWPAEAGGIHPVAFYARVG